VRRLILALLAVSCVLPIADAEAKFVDNVPPEVAVQAGGRVVEGRVAVGERLVCDPGSWTGGASEFAYEWVSGNQVVSSGLKDDVYKVVPKDEGHVIFCIVTAVAGNPAEDVTEESSNSLTVEGGVPQEEPRNTTPPELSGEAAVGKTLTCKEGTWTGNPTPTLTVKWLRGEEPIPSATGPTYVVKSEDAGHSLRCKVTASNDVGEASKLSNSVTIPAEAPANIKRPVIGGQQEVGHTLTCQPGTWSGTEPIVYEYKWLKKGSSVGVGAQFQVVREDEGQSLTCEVTASNATGIPATASSEPVKIEFSMLESLEPPVITGTVKFPGELKCSTGTWSGDPTAFKYQWLREGEAEIKEAIAGATEATYDIQGNDVGDSLYCQVTAERGSSSASRTSAPVTVPRGSGTGAPKLVSPPKIEVSGEASVGKTLTCNPGSWSAGSWSGSPRFSYVWRRSSEQNPIDGADEATYVVQSADRGHSLRCIVTAANEEGQATGESEPLAVKGLAPENLILPEILPAGTSAVGETLACTEGRWEAAPIATFTYRWLLEGSEQVGVGASYVVTASDRGHRLSCVVTAENGVGAPVQAASASVAVPGSAPEDIDQPSISGTLTVGSTLTCAPGKWSGAPEPTYTYQWLLRGEEIVGATAATFNVQNVDRGVVLSCRVTATNREGSGSAASQGVHVPGVRPENLEAPFVSGSAGVGQTLTCGKGVWNGKPPPEFKYQWLREGVAIGAAETADTHTVETADVGHLLTCNVIATNVEGAVEAESSNGVVIASHTAPPKVETPITTVKPVLPTAAEIRASLARQIASFVDGARIKSVIKVGGYKFSFTAPEAGTLELQWKQAPAKGAHGSAKRKPVVIARSSTLFTGARKGTVSLKLTRQGRQLLKGKKRISLTVTATFAIPHASPVSWSGTIVLVS
jgi:hypothetical protein